MTTVYDFSARSIDGHEVKLSEYRGKALLIVNVASECGMTPQYAGLEELYKQHRAQGFSVLGFPCNQFGAQEPGDEAAIANFCTTNYGVDFPMFAKIEVNGAHAHPLYEYLKSASPGVAGTEAIKWNFTKFLVGKDGKVIERYAPTTTPAAIENDIEKLL